MYTGTGRRKGRIVMKIENIRAKRAILDKQYKNIQWIDGSGLNGEELAEGVKALEERMNGQSRDLIKARSLEWIVQNGRIAIDVNDLFQEKLDGVGILQRQRGRWVDEYFATVGAEDKAVMDPAAAAKSFSIGPDFGHLSSNMEQLLEIGLGGVMNNIRTARAEKGDDLNEQQKAFYDSCEIAIGAVSALIARLAQAVRPVNEDSYQCLSHIVWDKPSNLYEAMQLMLIYFNVHENIFGSRIRTLGRLDVILYPFYLRDLNSGAFTKEALEEMTKYFLNKFWVMNVAYGLPFELGGLDRDGNEVTNELSYVIVKAYNELDIYSPKIHIRVSEKTPKDFIMLVLSSIREGKSSFVFANDNVVIKALKKAGITEQDARNYVLIGCYEPAAYAHEIGCTGNGSINGAKMLELVLNRGRDLKTGAMIGVDTGEITTYEELMAAIKKQIQHVVEFCLGVVRRVEAHYQELGPDPMVSALLPECLENSQDALAGGARYNNCSLSFDYVASLVDSIAVLKRLVFEEKRLTFAEFADVLKKNWEGHEKLRSLARALPEKYGNNNPVADSLMQEIIDYEAGLINGQPNGRGGVFKASSISIDRYVPDGRETMATPDGRYAGDPLSKNLCPVTSMDRNGVTALIESVSKIDYTNYPNGTVLDILLHPSAVSGEDGLVAMYALLMTYFKKGGLTLHGNVFDAATLRKAQRDPEKYANLQVRVCGWNAYFLNLSPEEQEDFIRKAENAAC